MAYVFNSMLLVRLEWEITEGQGTLPSAASWVNELSVITADLRGHSGLGQPLAMFGSGFKFDGLIS
jgi:hypothetical protein